ncbi:MAG TPA: hypothetical protein VG900_13735 [Hyphomicrobiaceae bacterium]|jgi:hypothetical protein|nr:hypothetical protein [Hyphomicrobiaceae bacterium]
MGSGWMIKTFDRAKWDSLFGSGDPAFEQRLLDSLLWENDGYFDDEAGDLQPGPNRAQILASQEGQRAGALARHLTRVGFTYEGLDAAQAVQLDEFGARLASPEALGDDLGVEWHSPDFYHQSCATELCNRTGSNRSWRSRMFAAKEAQPQGTTVRFLPLLLTGRRFGTEAQPTQGDACFYIVFSPEEVIAFRQEAQMAKDADLPWRDKWGATTTQDYLIAPLGKVIETGRWVLMTLNY